MDSPDDETIKKNARENRGVKKCMLYPMFGSCLLIFEEDAMTTTEPRRKK